MGKELFETLPDVLDAKLLASALSISKGRSIPVVEPSGFSNLAGGRTETCHKAEAGLWMEQHTNTAGQAGAGKENKSR